MTYQKTYYIKKLVTAMRPDNTIHLYLNQL